MRRKKTPLRKAKDTLWEHCKRIVRKRYMNMDDCWDCYTCDKRLTKPVLAQTGHFIPSSTCSVHMRYHLNNLRIQCYNCNINKSGNWVEFEKRLDNEMGDGFAQSLKDLNEATKGESYDLEWYETKIYHYENL